MKIPVADMPGVETARMSGAAIAETVYRDDEVIGVIVYQGRRKVNGTTEWGWRPAHRPRVKLTTKADAILRLR